MKNGNQERQIQGKYNKVTGVNPHNSHFIAAYPDGKVIKGNDLINTGWDDIPNGITQLDFFLSTGHFVRIPKFKAYRPLIEVSLGLDGSKVFHCINVECLTDKDIIIYKIMLKQDNLSKFKIGDIIIGRKKLPKSLGKSWKYTS